MDKASVSTIRSAENRNWRDGGERSPSLLLGGDVGAGADHADAVAVGIVSDQA
jgi:hypothetical protein